MIDSQWNDWWISLGGHLPPGLLALLCAAAGFAVALSAVSLLGARRPARSALLVALRLGGVGACLLVALEPALELRQVSSLPNQVAILVDGSRSMQVRPPDGGPSRAERAAALLRGSAPLFDRWRQDGHRVDVFRFGESLAPAPLDAAVDAAGAADATRTGEALGELRARYAGRDLGAAIVLSDGIDNGRIGRGPLDAETRAVLAGLGAPVHTVLTGEPHVRDLSVSAVLADEFAFVRTPIKIEAIIRQRGLAGRVVDVTLSRDGRTVDGRAVELGGEASEHRVAFDWTPDHPGNFVFEIAAPVLGGEALGENNAQVFTLKVIRDRVRVLHVCGRPSWDERFLRSLLRRDPNVDLVSFFILRTQEDMEPLDARELSLIPFPDKEIFHDQLRSFDLLVFHNFNYLPYKVEPYLAGVRDYVEGGGAIAMVGGDLSFGSGGYGLTPLRDVLPVELDVLPPGEDRGTSTDVFRARLTAEGRGHPVTSLSLDARENEVRWTVLPPLEGLNRVHRAKPGTATLLVHPSQKDGTGRPAPVLVAGTAGKGRALALLTDSAWQWGFLAAGAAGGAEPGGRPAGESGSGGAGGAETAAGASGAGRAFQRFWENAIRWLVRDPALTLLRIEPDRVEYRRGQPVGVRIRTLRPDYTPAAGVEVTLALASADRPADRAGEDRAGGKPPRETRTTTNQDGEARVDLGALAPGAWRISAGATLESGAAIEEQTVLVRAEWRELEDVASRADVLREIANLSGGWFRDGGDLEGLRIRPPRERRIGKQKTVELWSHPGMLALGLALLAIEWTLRRRSGHA